MPDPVLGLPPDQNAYQATPGHDTISTQLDGGASRYRKDQLGAAFNVVVQWTLNKTNAAYLNAFFRTYKAVQFTISLMLDDGEMRDYSAHFVPDTFNLVSQSGATWVYGATLEVLPNAAYAANDATIISDGPDV